MAFAEIKTDLNYWRKQKEPLFADLQWNVPEQKTGTVAVIGGNAQGFSATMRLAEGLMRDFPVRRVSLLFPEVLRGKLPPLENIDYAPATASGSLAKSSLYATAIKGADFAILPGDLSRNAETEVALSEAVRDGGEVPILVTRDAVDALAASGEFLDHSPLFLVASMAQLQKVFRAVFYPRMIMLSQPLLPTIETLHKFTLSYPGVTILTFHEGQIIVAHGGEVVTTPLEMTNYSPITLWSGGLATKVVGMNLYNPGKPLEATSCAILG